MFNTALPHGPSGLHPQAGPLSLPQCSDEPWFYSVSTRTRVSRQGGQMRWRRATPPMEVRCLTCTRERVPILRHTNRVPASNMIQYKTT